MAKKAGARKSTARKVAKRTTREAAGRKGVDFRRLHAEMDAALARLKGYDRSLKRDALILQLKFMRSLKLCPKSGMFAELE
jgi:hypothetical protein